MSRKIHLISIIKWLGVDLNEIAIDLTLSNGLVFDTAEWRKKNNQVIFHHFLDDLDYEFDFDEFETSLQEEIWKFFVVKYLN